MTTINVGAPASSDDHSLLLKIDADLQVVKASGELTAKKVDQLRYVVGLNGDLSPEAALEQGKRVRIVITRETTALERREHWGLALSDLADAIHFDALAVPGKWVGRTILAAVLFGAGANFGPAIAGWAAVHLLHLGG